MKETSIEIGIELDLFIQINKKKYPLELVENLSLQKGYTTVFA
jgi:hypothetical protein